MGLVELLADLMSCVEGRDTVFWDVGVWILLSVRLRGLITNDSLLCHRVIPELTRLQLPLVRVILSSGYMRCTCLLLEHHVVFDSRCRLEKVRFFLNSFIFLTEGLLSQVVHFFLKVFLQKIVGQACRAVICFRVGIVCIAHLVTVDLEDFFQSLM